MAAGGCLCGKLRYEFSGVPLKTLICHCNQCHKSTSSMYSAGIFLADSQFEFTPVDRSVYKTYSYPQTFDGAIQTLHFCGECSTLIWRTAESEKYKGMLNLSLGTIDDQRGVVDKLKPEIEFWIDQRTEWVHAIADASQALNC